MTAVVVDGQGWSGCEEVALVLSNALHWRLIGPKELAQSAERLGYDGLEFLGCLERPYGFLRRLGGLSSSPRGRVLGLAWFSAVSLRRGLLDDPRG